MITKKEIATAKTLPAGSEISTGFLSTGTVIRFVEWTLGEITDSGVELYAPTYEVRDFNGDVYEQTMRD